MKIRIKFEKIGAMKFIGHLDMMRYFQKAMRRADIAVNYSEGFSPHMIMSFAAPLGVGLTSSSEYMDIEISSCLSSADSVKRLNGVMAAGISVLSFLRLSEDAKNAMSIVAAADYQVSFREGHETAFPFTDAAASFYAQTSIKVIKKTKKSEKEVDIRPMIHSFHTTPEGIFMKLSTGSSNNVKPELVMEALADYAGIKLHPFALKIHRLEVYCNAGDEHKLNFIPLEASGEEIEG